MFFSTVAIASVAALAAASPVKRGFGGRATFYSTGLGACGQNNVDSDYIVALNSAQYGGGYPGPECFKQIQISANGKTATATIMDECPTCNYGDLDMSPSLFNVFATPDDGVFQMTWDYVNGNAATPSAESTSAAAESTSASVEATSAASEATSAAVAATATAEPTASSTGEAASSASATSNGRGGRGSGRKNRYNNNAVSENSTETATTTDSASAAPTVTATGDIAEIAAAVAAAGQVVIVGATSANGTASNGTTFDNATIIFQ